MPPAQIRDTVIGQLRATFVAMTSPEYLLDLDDAPMAQQKDSATRLLQVQHARLNLDNEDLSQITDELTANEDSLVAGTAAVDKSLQDLSDVQGVLTAVGSLLDIVARVLPLVLA